MRDYNRKLVEIVVSQALRKMKRNPKRELRRLVDFGKTMAKGDNQNEFFDLAQDIIKSDNSKYYIMIDRIFEKADNKKLKTFSMNLGYNGFIKGAKQMQENFTNTELSWQKTFTDLDLEDEKLSDRLKQYKADGIYIYVVFINDTKNFSKLLDLTRQNSDCAFILLNGENQIDERLINTENLIILINSKNIKNYDLKNVFGIWHQYDENNYETIIEGEISKLCEDYSLPFCLFVENTGDNAIIQKVAKYAYDERFKPKYAAFTMEYKTDIDRVNEIILKRNLETKFQNANANN